MIKQFCIIGFCLAFACDMFAAAPVQLKYERKNFSNRGSLRPKLPMALPSVDVCFDDGNVTISGDESIGAQVYVYDSHDQLFLMADELNCTLDLSGIEGEVAYVVIDAESWYAIGEISL